MSIVTDNDLKRLEDLIIASREENRQRFTSLEMGMSNLQGEMSAMQGEMSNLQTVITTMQKEIVDLRISVGRVEGSLQNQQQFVQKIPDLAERIGELKNWRQLVILVLTAFISSAVTSMIRDGSLKP